MGLRYVEAWLCGNGCVPLYGLMEDAATAEISRTQIWQWIRYPRGKLEDGTKITAELFRDLLAADIAGLKAQMGGAYATRKFDLAADVLERLATSSTLMNFLTSEAYEFLP